MCEEHLLGNFSGYAMILTGTAILFLYIFTSIWRLIFVGFEFESRALTIFISVGAAFHMMPWTSDSLTTSLYWGKISTFLILLQIYLRQAWVFSHRLFNCIGKAFCFVCILLKRRGRSNLVKLTFPIVNSLKHPWNYFAISIFRLTSLLLSIRSWCWLFKDALILVFYTNIWIPSLCSCQLPLTFDYSRKQFNSFRFFLSYLKYFVIQDWLSFYHVALKVSSCRWFFLFLCVKKTGSLRNLLAIIVAFETFGLFLELRKLKKFFVKVTWSLSCFLSVKEFL